MNKHEVIINHRTKRTTQKRQYGGPKKDNNQGNNNGITIFCAVCKLNVLQVVYFITQSSRSMITLY